MDELLSGWSRLAWAQCWQVTLLIAGLWMMLRIVGKNRPHLACALWLVVLVKCVTPPLVASPAGIFCWLQRAKPATDGAFASGPRSNDSSPVTVGDAVLQVSRDAPAAPLPALSAPMAAPAAEIAEPSPRRRAWSWSSLIWLVATVWLGGALLYSALAGKQLAAWWRKLRDEKQFDHPALAELVDDLRRQLKVRRKVRLLVTDAAIGPAVIGLWRPTVILPAALVREKTPDDLAPLLAHEIIHVCRGDLWIGLLQSIVLGLWWFHPLVRLVSRLFTRETERCCDEEVIARLGCEPAAYARGLLDVLALKQQLTPIPACPGVRPVDVTSQRLERIMKLGQGCHKGTPWWCWIVALTVAAAALPGAAFVVRAQERPRPKPPLPAEEPKQPAEPDVTQPADQASDAHSMARFHFETSGWKVRLTPAPGGTLDVVQTGKADAEEDFQIRGPVRLEAVTDEQTDERPDHIAAECDAVVLAKNLPAKLEIVLEGNVRLTHNKSRIEAKRIILEIDAPFVRKFSPYRKPAKVRMQIDGARAIELNSAEVPASSRSAESVPDSTLIDKVYPVADLVMPIPTGPIVVSSAPGNDKRRSAPPVKPDFEPLINLITETIEPDSWGSEDSAFLGHVTRATNSLSLVIRQTNLVHDKIGDLLAQLRRLQDVQVVLTLERLEVPAANFDRAVKESDSPLAVLAEGPKSDVWVLSSERLRMLKEVDGAGAQSAPRITAFNGQSVDLRLVDAGEATWNQLVLRPVVTADFRSIRLEVAGPAQALAPPRVRDEELSPLGLASERNAVQADLGLRVQPFEVPLQQTLVVAAADKSDTRRFLLITPQLVFSSEIDVRR